ncbi:MAG: ABC transporter [Cellvibrionales bacterium]|nr:ABC transporter [Cellvibrionales bacterium]|tara:strand:- start:3218 stop:4201 length:984 start_codon:yes stop_codon:yes gene_type:complete
MLSSQSPSALAISGLKKTYREGFIALKGIDLNVEAGDFFALLGPNGAGKSTTIGVICSLVAKTAGSVSVFGHDIDHDFAAAKRCIGVVPQEFNFNQFEKVLNIVVTQGGYYGLPRKEALVRAEKYLRLLDLWDKRNVVSRTLSGGMKRRLMIARALVHEPKLLILDEPTAGVDIELRRSMWDFLQQVNASGTTIILTTHYLEEAESLCRNIAIIDEGDIIANSSMKDLLGKLSQEVLVLDIVESLPPDFTLKGFDCNWVDAHCIEVSIDREQHVNSLFAALEAQQLQVKSLRNKANRLEEMFVSLLKNPSKQSDIDYPHHESAEASA